MIQKYIGHRPDVALLILRVVIGATFFLYGWNKLTGDGGVAGVTGFLGSIGIPAAGIMAPILIAVEILGGLALILGLGTRLAAILLALVMIIAIVTVKYQAGFFNGYEFDLALLTVNIALILQGGGKYSVDMLWQKKNSANSDAVMM